MLKLKSTLFWELFSGPVFNSKTQNKNFNLSRHKFFKKNYSIFLLNTQEGFLKRHYQCHIVPKTLLRAFWMFSTKHVARSRYFCVIRCFVLSAPITLKGSISQNRFKKNLFQTSDFRFLKNDYVINDFGKMKGPWPFNFFQTKWLVIALFVFFCFPLTLTFLSVKRQQRTVLSNLREGTECIHV